MVTAMLVFLTGSYIVLLGIIAKAFSDSRHFDRTSKILRFLNRQFGLEKGILTGVALIAISILTLSYLFLTYSWAFLPFVADPLRFDLGIWASVLLLLGVQFIFGSFVLSLFYLKVK